MAKKPKCMLTVDVEALALRAPLQTVLVNGIAVGKSRGE